MRKLPKKELAEDLEKRKTRMSNSNSQLYEIKTMKKSSKPCIEKNDKVKKALKDKKELANSQKNALSNIFNESCRPSWAQSNTNKVYLVPRA